MIEQLTPNMALCLAERRQRRAEEAEEIATQTENGAETEVWYITDQGGYMVESEVVAEKDARAIAIQHLSARLSAVAAASSPADQHAN